MDFEKRIIKNQIINNDKINYNGVKKQDIETFKTKMIFNKLSNIPEREQTLKILEDEIYTIDNRILNESERIELELKRLKVFLDKKKKTSIPVKVSKMLEAFDNINLETASSDALELCKRQIVLMELAVSMEITFFNAAYELLSAKQPEESRVFTK